MKMIWFQITKLKSLSKQISLSMERGERAFEVCEFALRLKKKLFYKRAWIKTGNGWGWVRNSEKIPAVTRKFPQKMLTSIPNWDVES